MPGQQIPAGAAGHRILARNLAITSLLMKRAKKKPDSPSLEAVVDVLNTAKVKFMLAGAHAIGLWANEPRTTLDVDILLLTRQSKSAVKALRLAFPNLTVRDTPVVVRFTDPELKWIVIDLMKPDQLLFKVAKQHATLVKTDERAYLIPNLEFALAMKFAAMISPNRKDTKKMQDGIDFMNIVRANKKINLKSLASLGDRVYPDGGAEIIDMVRRVRAGERLYL